MPILFSLLWSVSVAERVSTEMPIFALGPPSHSQKQFFFETPNKMPCRRCHACYAAKVKRSIAWDRALQPTQNYSPVFVSVRGVPLSQIL